MPSGTAASGLLRELEQTEGTERHFAEANRREEHLFKEHSHRLNEVLENDYPPEDVPLAGLSRRALAYERGSQPCASTIEQTVRDFFDRLSHRIEDTECKRVLEVFKSTHRCEHGTSNLRAFSLKARDMVKNIHQIFGLFGKWQAMPARFHRSCERWRSLVERMGAVHHLWTSDEVDALVQQKVDSFLQMYYQAPFPAMRPGGLATEDRRTRFSAFAGLSAFA